MAQNQIATITHGITKALMLKVGARVMLTVNVDIEDRLINGQIKKVSVKEKYGDNVTKLYVRLPSAILLFCRSLMIYN